MEKVRALAFGLAVCLACTPAGAADDVSVIVNGSYVRLDPPALYRNGEPALPLREAFVTQGGSVSVDRDQISATLGGHAVSLRVGSADATIDGRRTKLAATVFEENGRIYVPLRLFTDHLGAVARYDASSRTAYINSTGTRAVPTIPPFPMAAIDGEPTSDAPGGARPEISASFTQDVAPRSVAVSLDGRDETIDTSVGERSFVLQPMHSLAKGSHSVHVAGRTTLGQPFELGWTFNIDPSVNHGNFIRDADPPNGAHVESSFEVHGTTRPFAHVQVLAKSSGGHASAFEDVGGTITASAMADGRGAFRVPLIVENLGGGVLDVRITSWAPGAGSATRTLRLRQ